MIAQEALYVITRVEDVLRKLGERPIACYQVDDPDEERYALFQAGDDPATGRYVEQLFVYVNGEPLMFDDLQAEEIALHEARHVIQCQRGLRRYLTFDLIRANALQWTDYDMRVDDFLRNFACEAAGDILELDALMAVVLVCNFSCPIEVLLWQ